MNHNLHLENLSLYGGLALADNLPPVLTRREFESICDSLFLSESVFNAFLVDEEEGRSVNIFPVKSTSLACAIRPTKNHGATIVVPLGAITRIHILARLLLQYWNKSKYINIINSPLDDIPEEKWFIPEKLRPLFGEYSPSDTQAFWRDLEQLNSEIELPSGFDTDVAELLHLGVVHLVAHEFAHFWLKHFELLQADLSVEELRKFGMSQIELEKGVELHADALAGKLSMLILCSQVKNAFGGDDGNAFARGFLRLSYVITLLFSLYDPRRKYLRAYDQDRYIHPLVRRHLVIESANHELYSSVEFSKWLELWNKNELHGWIECMYALNDLNVDCMSGKYGSLEGHQFTFPVHITLGGSFTAPFIDRMVKESKDLVDRFLRILANHFGTND